MVQAPVLREAVLDELLTLIEDYHDYNPGQVAFFENPPSAIDFAKQVSKGWPCVYPVVAALEGCAASGWTKQYLTNTVKAQVEVATTPDGRADSLNTLKDGERVFLQPANVDMSLETLFDKFDASDGHGSVYYLQSQNSNLTSTPLQPLLKDLPQNFDFAQDVLGIPEAVNIWIGDEQSVTSVHRDPYENLYLVLRGSKTFTLWPPVDEVCMDSQMVRTGSYVWNVETSTFTIAMDEGDQENKIPWVPIDPQLPRDHLNTKHPLYKHAMPRMVEVRAGQMLYLPSGWYHHVAQRCGEWDDGAKSPCIAINYWYDMEYEGEKYVMRQLIDRLTQRVQEGS